MISQLFPSNKAGMMEVIKYVNWRKVTVRFVDTGYITTTNADNIRKGQVKDYLAPSCYGVGVVGVGQYKVKQNRKHTREYKLWNSMLERCYSANSLEIKRPTYKGCSVSERWHNFQQFCEDLPTLQGYAEWLEGKKYELDKDVKVPNNKVYSLETCMFIPKVENVVYSNRRNK